MTRPSRRLAGFLTALVGIFVTFSGLVLGSGVGPLGEAVVGLVVIASGLGSIRWPQFRWVGVVAAFVLVTGPLIRPHMSPVLYVLDELYGLVLGALSLVSEDNVAAARVGDRHRHVD
jgi:hypothetical protein